MKTLKDLRVVKAAEVNPDEGVVDIKTKKNATKAASAKAEVVGTNESMRELTRTINTVQTKQTAPLAKKNKLSLAKRLAQLLGPLKLNAPAKVSEDIKKPYVPVVDYVHNPKMKYTPPSVLRRLAVIKKRMAKETPVKEEVSSIDESKIEDKIRSHPAVEYYGGKDDHHMINLKPGYWHGELEQRSFSNRNASMTHKELKYIEKIPAGMEESVSSIDEARIRIVKARIRGGKLQRRKKVSNVKGYTIRGGKLTRMSSKERLDRKKGARIGKVKRRAKLARALVKRKRSLRKRSALGL
jgi:hypothetical protein